MDRISQEGTKMSLTALQLTEFKVKKLQCMGGEGRAAPYRITTYSGMELGSTGEIMEFIVEAGNDPSFEQRAGNPLVRGLSRLISPFKRANRD